MRGGKGWCWFGGPGGMHGGHEGRAIIACGACALSPSPTQDPHPDSPWPNSPCHQPPRHKPLTCVAGDASGGVGPCESSWTTSASAAAASSLLSCTPPLASRIGRPSTDADRSASEGRQCDRPLHAGQGSSRKGAWGWVRCGVYAQEGRGWEGCAALVGVHAGRKRPRVCPLQGSCTIPSSTLIQSNP